MRFSGNSILVMLLLLCCGALGADQAPSHVADSAVLKAARAQCWDQGQASVVELTGPVHIELDSAKMSAANAVVWILPNPDGPPDSHKLQIALIGNGQLQQEGVLRLDRRLLVDTVVTGKIELIGERVLGADESSALYQDAAALREGKPSATNPAAASAPTTAPASQPIPGPGGLAPLPPLRSWTQSTTAPQPTTTPQSPWLKVAPAPAPAPAVVTSETPPGRVIEFDGDYQRATTPDGDLAAVVSNGATLTYRDAQQNLMEFMAHDMVLFTNLKELKGAGSDQDTRHFIAEHIVSAYFEGDVQLYQTPASLVGNELRMRADHVYYEFATDRAIMTDVVFHTVDLKKQVPIFMRAAKLRQLSQDEYSLENVELTNSAFVSPTYSIRASHAYVRVEDTGDPNVGEQVNFTADNATMDAVGFPFFYFPTVSGTMDNKPFPLRTIAVNNDSEFGDGVRSRWGLFEFFGQVPPKTVNASFTADYLSDRGPAGGLDVIYTGGFVTDTDRQPWNVQGDFHSYFVDDHGTDVLGAARSDETPPDTFRGRLYLENQFFLPGDWQAQLRVGYVSDSNFMAQWFNGEYIDNLPVDDNFYVKHARDSEAFSFLVEDQPNRAISTADEEEENLEISRLPELSYQRVGDSLADDHLTFFSEDSGSALKFVRNTQTLAQQGFYPGLDPGLPAFAYTGDPGSTTYRGDFRQEVDYPINAGVLKVVPYVFVRDTAYSQGVEPGIEPQVKTLPGNDVRVSGPLDRIMGGGGVRLTTSFWKVDNTFESDILDMHRLRHIIEPELNVFASTANVGQDRLFIYDPETDAVSDVRAVQLALRQRWQTKRGGPGRWRNADVFALNLYLNYFGNQPSNRFRDPVDFRGLYFYGMPEASIPRNSANADATWRLSDSTAVLADLEQNLDKVRLASAGIGVAVSRDTRLTYFVGTRYIADLDSNIITLEANYKLDDKYSLAAVQQFDLAQNKDVFYSFSLYRSLDTIMFNVQVYYDQSTGNKGFSFGLQPLALGLGRGLSSNQPGVLPP